MKKIFKKTLHRLGWPSSQARPRPSAQPKSSRARCRSTPLARLRLRSAAASLSHRQVGPTCRVRPRPRDWSPSPARLAGRRRVRKGHRPLALPLAEASPPIKPRPRPLFPSNRSRPHLPTSRTPSPESELRRDPPPLHRTPPPPTLDATTTFGVPSSRRFSLTPLPCRRTTGAAVPSMPEPPRPPSPATSTSTAAVPPNSSLIR